VPTIVRQADNREAERSEGGGWEGPEMNDGRQTKGGRSDRRQTKGGGYGSQEVP